MQTQAVRRIDVHHHVYLPTPQDQAQSDPKLGWTMPVENVPWSPELSIKAMDELNIEMAILSNLPGAPAGGDSVAVRKANETMREIRDKYPERFGFFACLGDLRNVQGSKKQVSRLRLLLTSIFCIGVLEELRYAFDALKANGVSITSSYGSEEQLGG
jgi:hypothetical protein